MPSTFENHLTGVTTDQPHPLSEYHDLPLSSDGPYDMDEVVAKYDDFDMEERYREGYDDGREEGYKRFEEAEAKIMAAIKSKRKLLTHDNTPLYIPPHAKTQSDPRTADGPASSGASED